MERLTRWVTVPRNAAFIVVGVILLIAGRKFYLAWIRNDLAQRGAVFDGVPVRSGSPPYSLQRATRSMEEPTSVQIGVSNLNDDDVRKASKLTSLRKVEINNPQKISPPAVTELAALANLEDLSLGNVNLDNQGLAKILDGKHLRSLSLWKTAVTGEGLALLRRQPHIETLSLNGIALGKSGFQYIGELPNLRVLNLARTSIADADLKGFAATEKLEELYVLETNLTDTACEGIALCLNLRRLSIANTKITDAGFSQLSVLEDLTYLNAMHVKGTSEGFWKQLPSGSIRTVDLCYTNCDDAALRQLGRQVQIESLALRGTQVSTQGLMHLSGLTKLSILYLGVNPRIDDQTVEFVSKFSNLTHLDLLRTGVTDKAVEHLLKMKSLQTINVDETGITMEGYLKLSKKLGAECVTWDTAYRTR